MSMNIARINATTELYCVFGSPVRHSISPAMHNAAFSETGINAVYLAFEPPSMGEAISCMKALAIRGASVTIPFKIDTLRHCDRVDPLAAEIGSVNTLVNRDGVITGFNTDGYGALRALGQSGIPVKGRRCLLIGNGGSARAIAFTLAAEGAAVTIAGRDSSRIGRLAEDLRSSGHSSRSVLLAELDRQFMEAVDIIINSTPVGMHPAVDATPLDTGLLSPRHAVFDIVYAPHETHLLQAARRCGATAVHGIDMLLYQGARQFELWTGQHAPVETMRGALHHHLQRTE